jgi:hypothetical protein
MKRILYLWLSTIVVICSIFSITLAQEKSDRWKWDWTVNQDPIGVLDSVKRNANKDRSNEVQNTKLDYTMSECIWDSIWGWVWFTITKTLCNIKVNIRAYLQYTVFAWLTLATIFLIRNGFRLVTSSDKWKQMWIFKKNIIYIIIWVVLLISFYYILDIFVTLVNFVTE